MENSTKVWSDRARKVLGVLVDQYCREVEYDGDTGTFDDLVQSPTLDMDIVEDFMETLSMPDVVKAYLKELYKQ